MKFQLLKGDKKATFGSGDGLFDYWYRPLQVDEKELISSHVVWKKSGKHYIPDFSKFDVTELLRLAVTKIGRFETEDGDIEDIDSLLSLTLAAGELDGMLITMWTTIWISMNVPEDLKKK